MVSLNTLPSLRDTVSLRRDCPSLLVLEFGNNLLSYWFALLSAPIGWLVLLGIRPLLFRNCSEVRLSWILSTRTFHSLIAEGRRMRAPFGYQTDQTRRTGTRHPLLAPVKEIVCQQHANYRSITHQHRSRTGRKCPPAQGGQNPSDEHPNYFKPCHRRKSANGHAPLTCVEGRH